MGCIQMSTRRRSASFRNLRRSGERGAELVEMAFVLPLLLTLLIGVFWAARAYNIYETITRAAREGARVAVARQHDLLSERRSAECKYPYGIRSLCQPEVSLPV